MPSSEHNHLSSNTNNYRAIIIIPLAENSPINHLSPQFRGAGTESTRSPGHEEPATGPGLARTWPTPGRSARPSAGGGRLSPPRLISAGCQVKRPDRAHSKHPSPGPGTILPWQRELPSALAGSCPHPQVPFGTCARPPGADASTTRVGSRFPGRTSRRVVRGKLELRRPRREGPRPRGAPARRDRGTCRLPPPPARGPPAGAALRATGKSRAHAPPLPVPFARGEAFRFLKTLFPRVTTRGWETLRKLRNAARSEPAAPEPGAGGPRGPRPPRCQPAPSAPGPAPPPGSLRKRSRGRHPSAPPT